MTTPIKMSDPKAAERKIKELMKDYVEDGTALISVSDSKIYTVKTSWKYIDNMLTLDGLQKNIETYLCQYGLTLHRTNEYLDGDMNVRNDCYVYNGKTSDTTHTDDESEAMESRTAVVPNVSPKINSFASWITPILISILMAILGVVVRTWITTYLYGNPDAASQSKK